MTTAKENNFQSIHNLTGSSISFRVGRGLRCFPVMAVWAVYGYTSEGYAQFRTPLCTPPIMPFLLSDPAMQREYRRELAADYETFFSEAQTFMQCLQHANSAIRADIQEAIENYTTLLEIPAK